MSLFFIDLFQCQYWIDSYENKIKRFFVKLKFNILFFKQYNYKKLMNWNIVHVNINVIIVILLLLSFVWNFVVPK